MVILQKMWVQEVNEGIGTERVPVLSMRRSIFLQAVFVRAWDILVPAIYRNLNLSTICKSNSRWAKGISPHDVIEIKNSEFSRS